LSRRQQQQWKNNEAAAAEDPDSDPGPKARTRIRTRLKQHEWKNRRGGLKSGLDTGNTLGYTKLGVNDEAATLQQIRTSFLNVVTTITGIYYNNIYPLIY